MTNGINGNNINSQNFGNLTHQSRVLEQIGDTFNDMVANLWDMGFGYLEEHENVFSGSVAEETVKWQGRIHNLGVIMREGQDIPSFNSKM